MCFSLYLNKSTSYLLLCLSLNSFYDETSRTWASLGPETRYCGFWLASSSSHVGTSLKQGLGWVQVPATWGLVPNWVLAGFESQTEVNGFICECRVFSVAQLYLTVCDPMDCSPPGSSVHWILQARTLEWVAISFSRGSSQPRNLTPVSHITGRYFYCLSH